MEENQSIVELIKGQLSGGTTRVPVFHAVALRLQRVLAQQDFNTADVDRLISADAGLTSQVLRVANSSFYAGLSKVGTIQEAVIRLGSREVANIAMLATQQDLYRSDEPKYNALMQTLWRHAFCTATGSKWLALKSGYGALAPEAFLAGLLHDIGKLFLLKVMEELGRDKVLPAGVTPSIVTEVLDSMHVEVGHLVMAQWHLPEEYCLVVRNHHVESWDRNNGLLAMVRLANNACCKLGIGTHADPALPLFAGNEAQVLGLKEIALAELEIVVEDALKQPMSG